METDFEKKTSGHLQGIPNYIGHLHAENMKLYAEDAAVNEKPWELWEKYEHGDWHSLVRNPDWDAKGQYRRKPKTININGFDVPLPLRDSPSAGKICYIADLVGNRIYSFVWSNSFEFYGRWLKYGLIHKTKEAAELHLKALLSFTQQT